MNRFLTPALAALALTAIGLPAQDDAPAESEVAEVTFVGPTVVTTVGRADGTIVNVICTRAGVETTLIENVTAADLEGVATLVIAMGGSTKGLGAAGVDADAELERGAEMLAVAEEAGVAILGVHVGGEPRRGELSDPFCELVGTAADALVVKASGNADGFFDDLAGTSGIPLHSVETNGEAIEAIGSLFPE